MIDIVLHVILAKSGFQVFLFLDGHRRTRVHAQTVAQLLHCAVIEIDGHCVGAVCYSVRILARIDAEWASGECNGRTGMFPLSFVQLVPNIARKDSDLHEEEPPVPAPTNPVAPPDKDSSAVECGEDGDPTGTPTGTTSPAGATTPTTASDDVIGTCVCVEDFAAEQSGDLGICVGDTVDVLDEVRWRTWVC